MGLSIRLFQRMPGQPGGDMNKLIKTLATVGVACSFPLTAAATPEEDLAQFQQFFKDKFPTVSLEAYSDGVNALPQYAERRANWEIRKALEYTV
jgi:sulfur-oxidizing protein SoxA